MDLKRKGNYLPATDSQRLYFNEIRSVPELSKDEERKLFEDYRLNNNMSARDKIIESNQKFVVSVAKKHAFGDNLMDLVNEGNIGLIEAIEKFDYTLGYKFITYAVHYIERNIGNYILFTENIVKKSNIAKTFYYVRKLKERFVQENEREPSNDEMKHLLRTEHDIFINNIKDLTDVHISSLTSLESDAKEGYEQLQWDYNEQTAKQNNIENIINSENEQYIIDKLMFILSPIEKYIIQLRFGLGMYDRMTNEQLSDITGYTAEHIRKIVDNSLMYMKEYSERVQYDR